MITGGVLLILLFFVANKYSDGPYSLIEGVTPRIVNWIEEEIRRLIK